MFSPQLNHLTRRLIYSSAANLPVITMPAKLKERVEKVHRRIEDKERQRRLQRAMGGNRNLPIVSCKNDKLNHYMGQTYRPKEAIRLASSDWARRQSSGDYFTLNSFSGNPSCERDSSDSRASFDDMHLRPELLERLRECNMETPTRIQELAIPEILRGNNTLCAAETGSGKTLAFLLPILSNILDMKEMVNREDVLSAPLALILVPGRELAFQTQSVITKLTESLPITSTVLIGGMKTKKLMLDPPLYNVDIVVSTLGVIKKLVSSDVYNINDVRHIVIDEADTMLDDSFNVDTISFLKKFKFRDMKPANPADPNAGVQLVMVGATMPQSLAAILSKTVPYESIYHVVTPHLHRLMPHVPQKFLRMSKSDKPARLLQIVKPESKKGHRTMVFSKDAPTCDFVSMFLGENGIKALNLNGLMLGKIRAGRFEEFQDGLVNVLSCTDIGSRGLDTIKVQHIINYDFPRHMSDYIHRAGRVGRVGSVVTGHVTNFIASALEVDLVQKIEMAARKTESLSDVNANIKRKLMQEYDEAIDYKDYM